MTDAVLLFTVLPLVTAFIGYITNWAAIRMIFHPRRPVKIGPFAWQGIIYKLAPKLATEIAATTGLILTSTDLIERIEPEGLIRRLAEAHPQPIDELIADVFDVLGPGLWAKSAPEARAQIRTALVQELTGVAGDVFQDLAPRIDELVDLERLMVNELSGENADKLARVAEEIGSQELRFIEIYGGVFGFLIGIVQAATYTWLGQWWTLPVVGAIVGSGTNWLALQMIFRPLEPTRYLGLVEYQGMFPKRQAEISRDYGLTAANDIVTADALMRNVRASPAFPELVATLRQDASVHVAKFLPIISMMTGGKPSDEQIDKIIGMAADRVGELLQTSSYEIEAHLREYLAIEELIESRLSELDKQDFERLLRGIFEEDEIILILIGAALGGLVGTTQAGIALASGW